MNEHSPTLLPKVRSEILMNAIGGKFGSEYHLPYPCALRLCTFFGEPCAPRDTVVGCHLDSVGKGMSTKSNDIFVAAGCRKCHALIDRTDERWQILFDRYAAATEHQIRMAMQETLGRLLADGIITVKGGTLI